MKSYQELGKSLRGLKGYKWISGKLVAPVLCIALLAGFLMPAVIPLTASAAANVVSPDSCVWSAMDSGTTNELGDVWGSSSSDVFAVGYNGTLLHYNGSVWSTISSGTTNTLCCVWGSSSSDVFAVGYNGTILHYNGSAWSAMSSGTTNHLYGVWGSSSSNVFAVGSNGTILHYNGSVWSAMGSGTTNHLHGIWGTSSSDVFAVGSNGTILHYNGSVWSAMDSSSAGMMPGTDHTLFGVWGSSSSDVFVLGYKTILLHYNGSAWSSMESPIIYHGDVWGTSSSDIFIVGSFANIWHNNGSIWSVMSGGTTLSPTASQLHAIWGSSSCDVFAVGANGTILHYHSSSTGIVTATVASVPVPTGSLNEYALSVSVVSTADSRFSIGQQVWCAATTTDFPNLLTVGATLTGTLDNSSGWWVLKASTIIPPPSTTGIVTATVASIPVPTGSLNEYALSISVVSTTDSRFSIGQQIWCAATTTDFPNLLTIGATLTGTLDNSLGWWVLKASTIIPPPPTIGTVTATVASVPVPTGGLNEYALSISVISTTDSRFNIGQQVWCAATTTDFPSLLTVGATLTGKLDNSFGWWVFKK